MSTIDFLLRFPPWIQTLACEHFSTPQIYFSKVLTQRTVKSSRLRCDPLKGVMVQHGLACL